jgi:hypothetical protein
MNDTFKSFFTALSKENKEAQVDTTVNRDISDKERNIRELHSSRNDLLIEMWDTQTDQLATIIQNMTKNAEENRTLLQGFMGSMVNAIPEKSELTLSRREQQKRDLIAQTERDKDRSVLLGIHKLLEKLVDKEPLQATGAVGGRRGGLLSSFMKSAGKFWGFLKKGFLGVFAFLGKAGKGLFKFLRVAGFRIALLLGTVADKLISVIGTVGKFLFTNLGKLFGRLGTMLGGILTGAGKLLAGIGGKLLKGLMNPAVLAVTAAALAGKAIANNINKTTEILEQARKASADADKQQAKNVQAHRQRAENIVSDIGKEKVEKVLDIRTGELNVEEFLKLSQEDRSKFEQLLRAKRLESSSQAGRIRGDIEEFTDQGDKVNVKIATRHLEKADKRIAKFANVENQIKDLNKKAVVQESKRDKEEIMKVSVNMDKKQDRINEKEANIKETQTKIDEQKRQEELDMINLKTSEEIRKLMEKELRDKELVELMRQISNNTKKTSEKEVTHVITGNEKKTGVMVPVHNMPK